MQHSNHQQLNKLPAAWCLLGELALKPAKHYLTQKETFNPGYQVNLASIDLARLEHYEKVCGFTATDFLPITYPHLLAFRLQLYTLLKSQAAFSVLGLIHISNCITQFKAIPRQQPLNIQTQVIATRSTRFGFETTLTTQALIEKECVWQSNSVFLNKKNGLMQSEPELPREKNILNKNEIWSIPKNTGRRYARVSEDFNPIHLYSFSARVFGFKQAIAHGMWMKGRCCSALNLEIDKALQVKIQFKSPIFLPAKVLFEQQTIPEGVAFSVLNAQAKKSHLTGKVLYHVAS